MLQRRPSLELRPFLSALWTADARAFPVESLARERVLPTGGMHLAFVIAGDAPRIFEGADDGVGRSAGATILGGARSSSYVRDARGSATTVGIQIRPGAATRLLGVDVDEFAERHVDLTDVWGRAAVELAERLAAAPTPERRLDTVEDFLRRRIVRARATDAIVADALARFAQGESVGAIVRANGYSHRHFARVFQRTVGLSPKQHARVLRFQNALATAKTARHTTWTTVALAAGYCDQSHFNREFDRIAGMTPGRYRALAPLGAHHVPLDHAPTSG